jgi:hypothetical protein
MCNAYPGYTYDVRGAAAARQAATIGVADVDLMWVA